MLDALITGLHDPGSSHVDLMRAFGDTLLIERGYGEAEERGYLAHEYGDLALLMRPVVARALAVSQRRSIATWRKSGEGRHSPEDDRTARGDQVLACCARTDT